MARAFQLIFDNGTSSQTVRAELIRAHGFRQDSKETLVGPALDVVVRSATKDDLYLAEPGIADPAVVVTLIPNINSPSRVESTRAIFAITRNLLQVFSSDAALTAQDASTCVLRLNGIVHVDRQQVSEEYLSASDVAPSPLVVGIPVNVE